MSRIQAEQNARKKKKDEQNSLGNAVKRAAQTTTNTVKQATTQNKPRTSASQEYLNSRRDMARNASASVTSSVQQSAQNANKAVRQNQQYRQQQARKERLQQQAKTDTTIATALEQQKRRQANRQQTRNVQEQALLDQSKASRRLHENATAKTAIGSLEQAAGGHLKTIGDNANRHSYSMYKDWVNNEVATGRMSEEEGEQYLKNLEASPAAKNYEKWQNSDTRKAFSKVYEAGTKLNEMGNRDVQEASEGAKGLKKAYLGAVNSGVGMLTDLAAGPAWALSMYSRTYGNNRGQVEALGGTTAQDMTNAGLQAIKETATEHLFMGVGLARGLANRGMVQGLSIADKVGARILAKAEGRTANFLSGLGRVAAGTMEENAEELAGWALDPLITEIAYGGDLRKKEARNVLKEQSARLLDQFPDENSARAAALYVGSDEFIEQNKKSYMESGLPEKESQALAETMQEYMIAALTNDTETMLEKEQEMIKFMSGAGGISKDSWSLKELGETFASTTLLTATTGIPSAITTSQVGTQYQSQNGKDAVQALAKTAINLDPEMSAKAQAMQDRMDAGKDLTGTQVYDLMMSAQKAIQETSERANTAMQVAKKGVEDENLIDPVTAAENGSIELGKVTDQKYDEDVDNTLALIDEYNASTEGEEERLQLREEDKELVADAVAAFNAGVLTPDHVYVLSRDNQSARNVFTEATGIDLNQYDVYDKKGNLDVVQSNINMQDALFAQAAQNYIESARVETAQWENEERGAALTSVSQRMESNGVTAVNNALLGVDARDRGRYLMTLRTADSVYHAARNTGEEWDDTKRDFIQRIAPDADIDALRAVYDAGLMDREAAEDTVRGKVVKIGEAIKTDNKANAPAPMLKVNTHTPLEGSVIGLFSNIVNITQTSIVLSDNLGPKVNGTYDAKTDTIILNVSNEGYAARNIGYTFMHEFTHHLQEYAPEEYQALKDAVRQRWEEQDPDGFKARIAAKIEQYKGYEDLTEDRAIDELIADGVHEFLNDEAFVEQICDENPTLAKSIINAIRNVLRKLRQLFGMTNDPMYKQAIFSQLDMLAEAEELWLRAFQAAVKNKAEAGLIKWNEQARETNNGEVFSISGNTARWTNERIDNLMKEYGASSPNYSQAYAVLMNPRDFLKLTLSDDILNRWNEGANKPEHPLVYDLDEEELRGEPLTPFLKIWANDGTEVQGHEGRHRMRALMKAGVTSVPVVIWDLDTKYSKHHLDSMTLSSKDFGEGPVNGGATVELKDLVPIRGTNRDELIEKFGGEADVRFSLPEYTQEEMDAHRQTLIDEVSEYYDSPYTNNYDETGWIFPDGKMLRMGMDGMRGEDHRIARHAYDDNITQSEGLHRFNNEGNIRFNPESNSLEFGTGMEPTTEQYAWIEKMVNRRGISMIEFTDLDNNSADYRDYEMNEEYPSGYEVVQDIKRFYREGKVGGSEVNQFRYSLVSSLEAVGCEMRKEKGYIVAIDSKGNRINEFTEDFIRKSPLGRVLNMSVRNKILKETDVKDQVKFLKDIYNMILTTQDPDLIWAVSGTIGYDPAHLIDEKTPQAWIKEQKSKFASITGNADPQYKTTIDFSTICVKTQAVIDAMSATMKRLHRGLTEHEIIDIVYNETKMAGEQVPCPVCYVFSRWVGLGKLFGNIKEYQEKFPEDMDMDEVRAEFEKIQAEVDALVEKQTKKKSSSKARNDIYKATIARQNQLELPGKELTKAEEKELARIKKRLDILDRWAWLEKTRLQEDYKPVPDDVLFDINVGRKFATEYLATWRFRTTRGPSLGKAAAPYSPSRLGDTIRGIASPSSIREVGESERVFLEEDSKSAADLFDKAVMNAKRQNRMNGQRLQSTSDFRFEYGLDYLLSFIELGAIGAKAQMYTKVPEAVKFLASTGSEVNCSIMPKGTGVEWNEKTQSWDLVFSDVTGMAWEDAKALSKIYNNVQPILVAIGKQHLISAMAHPDITMIIPFHASGSSQKRYISMMRTVGEEVKERTDFAKYESEHVYAKKGRPALCRDIRTKLLMGEYMDTELTEEERDALSGNEILRQLYIRVYGKDENGNDAKPDPKYVENFDENGNDADCYHVFLNKDQAGVMMPYEYWDKTSTIETADEQGKAYVKYCKSLGIRPVFSGYSTANKYDKSMDFTQYPGYWKTLIDRCMYNLDGSYHKQQAVNVKNADLDMLDSEQMRDGIFKPLQVNDPTKTAEIANRSMERISAETGESYTPIEGERFSLTETDADGNILSDGQMEFFKNSKARDENGKLLPMYHFTLSAGFTVFDPSRSYDGGSISFTDDFDFASNYAGDEWETAVENRYGDEELEPVDLMQDERPGYYECYLNMENPMVVDGTDMDSMDPYDYASNARDEGYDGLIIRNFQDMGADIYQVFSSEQVKDTRNQNPTNSNDIRYSLPAEDADGNELSEGQRKFFAGSKAVDEQGRLVPVYHTTSKGGFTVFDPNYSDDFRSLFFSDSFAVSQTYAKNADNRLGVNGAELKDWNSLIKYVKKLTKIANIEWDSNVPSALDWGIYDKRTGETAHFDIGEDIDDAYKKWVRAERKGQSTYSDYYVSISLPFKDDDWGSVYRETVSADSMTELLKAVSDSQVQQSGYYECYLNLQNPLEVDAQGHEWNDIPYSPLGESLQGYKDKLAEKSNLLISDLTIQQEDYSFDGPTRLDIHIRYMKKKPQGGWYLPNNFEKSIQINESEEDAWNQVMSELESFGLPNDYLNELIMNHTNYDGDVIWREENRDEDVPFDYINTETGSYEIIDASLFEGDTYTTRDLAELAEEQGKDGVIIHNCIDLDFRSDLKGEPRSTIYIAFTGKQVKDTRNLNPTEDPDIRFSMPPEEDVFAALAEEFKDAEEVPSSDPVIEEGRIRMAKSKAEFFSTAKTKWNPNWLTEGKVLKESSVKKEVRELVMRVMQNSDTKYKYRNTLVDKTVKDVTEAYRLMKESEHKEATDVLWNSALHMIENVEFFEEDAEFELYKEIRSFLRTYPITLDQEYYMDVDYGAFRRRNRGKLRLVKDGTPVDVVYGELAEKWPGIFNAEEYSTPPDQLLHIEEVIKNNIDPFRKAYTSEEAAKEAWAIADSLYDIAYEGEEYVSSADKYANLSRDLKARHEEAMRKVQENNQKKVEAVRQKEQRKAKKKIDALRQRGQAKIDKLRASVKQKTKDKEQKRREVKERAKHFGHIVENYEWLVDRVLTPTKEKNVPEELRKPLAEMLQFLDLQTERSKRLEEKTGKVAQKTLKMRELKDSLNALAKRKGTDEVNTSTFEIDALVEDMLEKMANKLDRLSIDELDIEDLKNIDILLKTIRHNIQRNNQIRIEGEKIATTAKASQFVRDMDARVAKYGKKKTYNNLYGKVDNIVNMGMLTPSIFFGKTGAMYDVYMEMRRGFDTYIRNEAMIMDEIKQILEPYYKKTKVYRKGMTKAGSEISSWSTDETAQTFELTNGSITLSVAQMMSLYCLKNRQQALGHMYVGGVVATPIQAGSKLAEKFKGKEENAQGLVLTEADIKTIVDKLTDEQKEVASKLQNLMATKMAEIGNQAHRELYGYEMFEDPDYFPIKSSQQVVATDINNPEQAIQKIKSYGAAKPLTPHASNALMLEDIFDVVAEHCNGMNLYASYLVPLSDFMRFYNATGELENGKPITVKQALTEAYGEQALTYVMNFMRDINGIKTTSRGGVEDMLNGILGHAKRAAVFGNVRVALQQPTAVVRAFAVMNPKYFVGTGPSRKAMQEMIEHCPIAQWKSWGFYDAYMGRDIKDVMFNNYSVSDQILAGAYGELDNLTWSWIWSAVKKEIAETHPDVEEGSEEFWKLCNERASYVFDNTQVVDSTFHRSNDMRSKSVAAKLFTAFKSEPTLTFNVFRNGIVDAHEKWLDGDKTAAAKILARATSVIVGQALIVSFAQALADAWRGKKPKLPWGDDDDFEKMTKEELLEYAVSHGIPVDTKMKKAEMLDVIMEHENEKYADGMLGSAQRYAERVGRNTVANFFDNIDLVNNIYLVGDFKNFADYMFSKTAENNDWPEWLKFALGWDQTYLFSNSNLIFSGAENIAKGYGELSDARKDIREAKEEGKVLTVADYYDSLYAPVQKFGGGIGSLVGFPLSTLMRDTKPIWDKMLDGMVYAADSLEEVETQEETRRQSKNVTTGVSPQEYKEILEQAKKEGQSGEEYNRRVAQLINERSEGVQVEQRQDTYSTGSSTAKSTGTFNSSEEYTHRFATDAAAVKAAQKRIGEITTPTKNEWVSIVNEKAQGLSGQARKDKIWDIVGSGYTERVEMGDYAYVQKVRSVLEETGGDVNAFDQKVFAESKTALKKTLVNDPSPMQIEKQQRIKDYLLQHGMSEEEISSEILYKSYMAKDLKAALRMGNEEYIMDELTPLVQAGLTYDDFVKLYKYRNYGAKNYTGKYTDEKYATSTGKYKWPATGEITSGYGYRGSVAGTNPFHRGIDIGGNIGDPVTAADGGTVIAVNMGYNGGYGNQIKIRHDDGTITWYNHLSGANVNVGDTVGQGSQIGQIGATGAVTGPHLDFMVEVNGEYVDPLTYLKA